MPEETPRATHCESLEVHWPEAHLSPFEQPVKSSLYLSGGQSPVEPEHTSAISHSVEAGLQV